MRASDTPFVSASNKKNLKMMLEAFDIKNMRKDNPIKNYNCLKMIKYENPSTKCHLNEYGERTYS